MSAKKSKFDSSKYRGQKSRKEKLSRETFSETMEQSSQPTAVKQLTDGLKHMAGAALRRADEKTALVKQSVARMAKSLRFAIPVLRKIFFRPIWLLLLPLIFGLAAKMHNHGATLVLSDPELGSRRFMSVIPYPGASPGKAHAGMPTHAVFSNTGQYIATAGSDGLVKIWHGKKGDLLARIHLPGRLVPERLVKNAVKQSQAKPDTTGSRPILGLAIIETRAGSGLTGVRIVARWLEPGRSGNQVTHLGYIWLQNFHLGGSDNDYEFSGPTVFDVSERGTRAPARNVRSITNAKDSHRVNRHLAWLNENYIVFLNKYERRNFSAKKTNTSDAKFYSSLWAVKLDASGKNNFGTTFDLGTKSVTAFTIGKAENIHLGFADGTVATAIVKRGEKGRSDKINLTWLVETTAASAEIRSRQKIFSQSRLPVIKIAQNVQQKAPKMPIVRLKPAFEKPPHKTAVMALDTDSDGRLYSASGDGEVLIWEKGKTKPLSAIREIATLKGHKSTINYVSWNPDGTMLATASDDNAARIWDVVSGDLISVLTGHSNPIEHLAWNPSGTMLATASIDSTARLWDIENGSLIAVLRGHEDRVSDIAWNPSGTKLAAVSYDKTLRIWEASAGKELLTIRGHSEWVNTVAWSPDGTKIATASADNTARLWDAVTGNNIAVLKGHTQVVRHITWNPQGTRLATASWDNTGRIWDAKTGKEIAILKGHSASVNHIAWDPTGRLLATASLDGTARIWNGITGEQVHVLKGHRSKVNYVNWNPQGTRVATAADENTARIWNVAKGIEIGVLDGTGNTTSHIAWNPDGTRLATAGNDGVAHIWDVAGLSCGVCGSLSVSLRSGQFVLAGDNSIAVVRSREKDQLPKIFKHAYTVIQAFISANGENLITISEDAISRLWSVADGSQTGRITGHGHYIVKAALSPSGSHLLTIDFNGRALLSNLETHRTLYKTDVVGWGEEMWQSLSFETLTARFNTVWRKWFEPDRPKPAPEKAA